MILKKENMMNLRYDNWMVKLINSTFDIYPRSLCSFFWLLVFSLVLYPVLVPTRLLIWGGKKVSNDINLPIAAGIFAISCTIIVLFFIVLIWGSIVTEDKEALNVFMNNSILFLFGSPLRAFATIWWTQIVGLGVALLIGYLVELNDKRKVETWMKLRNAGYPKPKVTFFDVIAKFLKAKKAKMCPIIHYTNDEKE